MTSHSLALSLCERINQTIFFEKNTMYIYYSNITLCGNNMEDTYTPIKISNELAKHIDEYIQNNPKFRTRSDFVRYVIRYYMDTNKPIHNDHADKTNNLEER